MSTNPPMRKRHQKRHEALKLERSTWLDQWRELARQIRPRIGRFLEERSNDGRRKDSAIINGKPIQSQRILQAGMMAGISPPSRPWYRLTTQDRRDSERDAVKTWLSQVEEVTRETLQKAHLYRGLYMLYGDLGVHGTGVLFAETHRERVLHGYVMPIGSFCLATNGEGFVDTLYRDVRMTTVQMVRMFGEEAVSPRIREAYKRGDWDVWNDVAHCVSPNEDYTEGKLGPAGKKFASLWWEPNGGDADEKMLRVSGYDTTPLLAPRWEVNGEDIYGNSPGMTALGDCRALQHLERRKAQLLDKVVDPPMKAPVGLQNQRISLLPGGVTFVPEGSAGNYEPAYQVNPQAGAWVSGEIQRHESRIESAFYADLWLMLSQTDGTMTAREVVERREEKLLQLGPVMESLHGELLSPLIDRVFSECLARGMLPEPPEELAGQELKVEYISIMAQAQKMLGTTGVERLTGFITGLAQLNPQAVDKLDVDQAIDVYSGMLGTPPEVIRPDDAVEAMRAERAQAAQMQQGLEQAQALGQTAKLLGEAKTDGDSALSTMLRSVGAK